MDGDDGENAARLQTEKQMFYGLGPDVQKLLDETDTIEQLLGCLKNPRMAE